MKQEMQRRQNLTAKLAAYLETRPYQVITHAELVAQVGENFRSRIPECKARLKMVIDNVPVVKADGTRGYGSYIYRPGAIGRDTATFVPGDVTTGTLFDVHPTGWHR